MQLSFTLKYLDLQKIFHGQNIPFNYRFTYFNQ